MTNINGKDHKIIDLKKGRLLRFRREILLDHTRTTILLVVICMYE